VILSQLGKKNAWQHIAYALLAVELDLPDRFDKRLLL
jgi:hypothetical protein